jgi:predicted MFS family arabinose efflux permease
MKPATGSPASLTRALMTLVVIAVFTSAGTIHYQTPMLGKIAAEFAATPAAAGWVATLSFGGYFVGTMLLVPLGDGFEKRRLVLMQMAGLVAGLLVMAAAPSLWVLAVAALVVGICCTVSQHVLPMVSEWSEPSKRGTNMGTLLSGLFVGILWARLAGGFVAEHFHWRWMYVIAAGMVAVMACVMFARLPSAPPKTGLSYAELLHSMLRLYREQPVLRRASAIQFLTGLCYGSFWATLASMLMQKHGLGPGIAGLMAIPGAAGVLVSRSAGRWTDRVGAGPVVRAAACSVILAYVAFSFALVSVAAVVVGAILLDCGLRASAVANQTRVIEILPEARSRSSTVFMGHMWGGNSAGAFLASAVLTRWDWYAVCIIGLSAAGIALAAGWGGAPKSTIKTQGRR